ncbi:hypothetical protein [Cohnella silvisoli]|uniref:Uncharacterized protein n=1 Tax=Cohnella silvisoli TaxID=2873699 RepID=A0ABV1KPC6_9BACL|nr:hypothetical protein [Cohnella silvisoli]MCD9025569.1 hypothetical protein [Cohnella silvisoli]
MGTFQRFSSPLMNVEMVKELRIIGPPEAHTDNEISALMSLITSSYPPIETIVIGHGREIASVEAAQVFARHWEARGGGSNTGGVVLAMVSWPEEAASWLRPANRFTELKPDGWIVTGALLGWAQMSRRLRHSTSWDPRRTYGFASLADSRIIRCVGGETLEGMRGVWSDGNMWLIENEQLISYSSDMNKT